MGASNEGQTLTRLGSGVDAWLEPKLQERIQYSHDHEARQAPKKALALPKSE
jgi:hypothetical protein